MFVHLRGRGTYSMLEGIGSNESILQRAKQLDQPAIALTDFNGVYGAVDFYSRSKQIGVQALIGVELPYISHRSFLGQDKNILAKSGTIVLLALSHTGYHNLLSLVSASYDNAHYDVPCLDNEILSQYSEDIIVLIGGLESYVYQSLSLSNDTDKINSHLQDMIQIYGKERVVIDITAQLFDHYPVLLGLHEYLLSLAQENGLTVVTTSGFTYPLQEQKTAYETALAIKDNKKTYDPDSRKILGDQHILSEDEVRNILIKNGYSLLDSNKWIENTVKISQLSKVSITLGQSLFPNYEVPESIQKLYEQYKDILIQE